MEVEKNFIHMNNRKTKIVSQITLDEDFNVPDVNPDIETYITRDVMVHMEPVRASEGKVNVSGQLRCKILYMGREESQMVHSMDNELYFDEIINSDKIKNMDVIHGKCHIEDLSIGIINSRKISIRAVLTFTLHAEEMHDIEVVEKLEEEEAVFYRTETQPILQQVLNKKDTYRIREDIEIPASKPNIASIIWNTLSLNNISTKLYDGRVGISGELVLFLIYSGEEEETPVQWMESVIPFDGSIDVAECSEDMIGDIEYHIASVMAIIKPDLDGEQRMVELEVVLELAMGIYREDEISLVDDLYSLKKELVPQYTRLDYSSLLMKNISKCKVTDRLHLHKDTGHILQILSSQGEVSVDEITVEEKGLRVDGIVKMKIMYISAEDRMPLNIADEVVPFSHLIEAEGINEQSLSFIRPALEQIMTVMTGNNEIEVKCTVILDTLVINHCNKAFMTDVECREQDLKKLQEIPGIAGYVVKENDSLWEIAKRYYTTIPTIMKVNEMTKESLKKGDVLLIVKETP